MNLLEQLVQQALKATPEYTSLQTVVEKELLHHDVLREMSHAGLLTDLTFIGGTCLRACYGAPRLSEDLDFTGGRDFTRTRLASLAEVMISGLERKYSLKVRVAKPVKESTNVDTWKLTIITHPDRADLPAQKIHIDICAIPSHDARPTVLRNIYGVDMGTSGLVIRAQSREEILADKFVAMAFRPNRLKQRDLWDVHWLTQQGLTVDPMLIATKIADRKKSIREFKALLRSRVDHCSTATGQKEFLSELRRFLPSRVVKETLASDSFATYLGNFLHEECRRITAAL